MARPHARTVVGVDLDDIDCYHAIHGLRPPTRTGLALSRWLPRFVQLFEELDVRATFFVIGRDAEGAADALTKVVEAGHELGNHSYAHAYDLSRWSSADLSADLRRCDALLRTFGAQPEGFRAPGYTHDARMLRAVADLGYTYDSSSLPSPPYYLAKLGVMAAMRLRGRASASQARGAATFFGRSRPHFRTDVGLWSLPISVTPLTRVPMIGTSVLASPLARPLAWAARRRGFLNLELHAIDLADAGADDLDAALVFRQPELKVPLAMRRERLRALLLGRGGAAPLRDAVPRR